MRSRRVLSALVVGIVIAVAVSLGFAGAASAHDVLISSSPADNATIATAPASLSFTFDQPVQNFDPVVSLIGPDGKQYATGTPSISGNVLSGTVDAGPAGRYTAAFRIVSADGHPVTGEIHFTLTGDGGTTSGESKDPRPPRRREEQAAAVPRWRRPSPDRQLHPSRAVRRPDCRPGCGSV